MGDLIPFPNQPSLPGMKPARDPYHPSVRKAIDLLTCWACGVTKAPKGYMYCVNCSLKGLDNPMISCRHDGCSTVQRRQYRGQSFFRCPEHREETNR